MDSVIWIENVAEPKAEMISAGKSKYLINAVVLCFTTRILRRNAMKSGMMVKEEASLPRGVLPLRSRKVAWSENSHIRKVSSTPVDAYLIITAYEGGVK